MIKAEVKGSIKFPPLALKKDLQFVAERIIVPILQSNIEKQIALDERPLKPNDPKYTERKIKKGLRPEILIATGKLRRDFFVADAGPYAVKVRIHPERSKIGVYLMDMGKNFFGVSTRMEENAMTYMKKRIREILLNARS